MDRILRLIQFVGFEPFAINHPERKQGRSPKWATLRKKFLADNPVCCVSGLKTDLDIHHVIPFHVDPARELDPKNLRTLSRPYHFFFGHFCNWKEWNPEFDLMVKQLRDRITWLKANY